MCKKVLFLMGLLFSAMLLAQAEADSTDSSLQVNALQQLKVFTEELNSFSAGFTQSVFDGQGRLEETSSGTLHLNAPNLLRWYYTEPFAQLIVADGSKVWSHDIELEQITVREQSAAQAQSPLTLLTNPDKLYQSFTLRNLGLSDGLAWLEMLPHDDRSNESGISSNDFARILVALRADQLVVMILEDTLGQSTEIRFTEGFRNGELDPNLFVFEPPAGVDVLEG